MLAAVDFDIGDNTFDNEEAAANAAALAALKMVDGCRPAAAANCECS